MLIKYKRLFAFFLDITLVVVLTLCMSSVEFANPYVNKYTKAYEEFSEQYNDSYEVFRKDTNIKKFVNSNKDNLNKVSKYEIYINIWYLVFSISYFGLFQYFAGGRTVGKRLFRLKIVNEDDSDVSCNKMVLRTLLHGSNMFMGINILILLQMLFLGTLSSTNYFYTYMAFSSISFILEIALIVTFAFRKDSRSLNDLVFKTKVVESN